MSRDTHGKIMDAVDDLISALYYWTEAEGANVVGDAAVNGTTIVSLSVPATTTFVCTKMKGGTNISAALELAYGTIASHTNVDFIDLQNVGSYAEISDGMTPLFVYRNSTAAAVTLLMIAPQVGYGAGTTNNDANHYFYGFLGGLLIPD